jgi:GNAT superfamily N-acetyltransferase
MKVRSAKAGDLAAVASCAALAFGVPRSPDNRVELALQIREGSVQVMCDAGRVLGFISFSPNRDHLFVEALAVLQELQGQGIGSRLLGFAEQMAGWLGLCSVRLFTSGEVASNLMFYRRRGYHETGRCHEANFSRVFYSKYIAPRRHESSTTHQPVRHLALVAGYLTPYV